MLSVVGVIVGILVFVLLVYKGFNIVIAAFASSAIMILTAQMPLYETLIEVYMTGMGGFLKSYFLLFALSAVLGRIMSDSGGAKKIAMILSRMVDRGKPENKKFLCVVMVPILYFVLSYVGISGFVLVFTIVPIAKNMFQTEDVPWKMYCFGGPQAVGATMVAGSLQAGNVYARDVCGTPTTAGAALSLIAMVVWWIATVIVIKILLKSSQKAGETFMTDGSAISAMPDTSSDIEDENLPSFIVSIIPLVLVIGLSAAFKIEVVPALFISCVVAIILFFKNLKSKLKDTLTNGLTGCYGSIISVSATFAIGSVIKAVPAFELFTSALGSLPGLAAGAGLGVISAFIMASSSNGISIFGPQMLESYTSAGISAGVAHRLMTITSWPCLGPHSAGIANAASVTKIEYTRCLKIYLIASMVPGVITMAVCLIFVGLGIIV